MVSLVLNLFDYSNGTSTILWLWDDLIKEILSAWKTFGDPTV